MDERDLNRDLTDDISSKSQKEPARVGKNKKNKDKKKRQERKKIAIYAVLFLLFWSGLVYGGYYYGTRHLQQTQDYFATQMNEVKLENQRIEEEILEKMKLFHDELEKSNLEIVQVRQELNTIQDELELTGETITGSDETRQSMQERMTELDEQLTALQEQLEKLEEAARAF